MEIDISVAAAAAVDARKRQSEKDSMEEEGAKRGGGRLEGGKWVESVMQIERAPSPCRRWNTSSLECNDITGGFSAFNLVGAWSLSPKKKM